MTQRPYEEGNYLIGRDGRPVTDRYGRPIRRRQAQPSRRSGAPAGRHRRPEPQKPQRQYSQPRPQQHFPDPREQQRSYQRPPRRDYQRPPRQAARRRRPRVRPGGCLGSGLAILLVLLFVGGLWADAKLTRVDALPDARISNTAGTNWLLVGSDSRQGLSDEDIERLGTGGDIGVGRTDTVMLLHIPNAGTATLVSLPRDSYVEVPGYGMDKLNAAFTYGGPKLLSQTVEQATGLRVDHYAEIGMGGLANVVDAVGGVGVCPQEAIDDPLANLSIQAGCQNIDGPTALGYVRTRASAQGDLDRVARQREFFAALLNKVTSPGTFLNPFRSIHLINDLTSSFTVGKGDHIWHLARVPFAMRGVETVTVPVGGFADYDVGSVVLWDEAGSEQLWDSLR